MDELPFHEVETTDKTFEDPSITAPEDRMRAFGQQDHVRNCGPDYIERMTEVGFTATTYLTQDILDPEEGRRTGVPDDQHIFFCERR